MLQQIVAIFAEEVSFVENAAKAANDQRDLQYATGAGESALVQLNAILRNPGTKTIIPLELRGIAGTRIPAGAKVAPVDRATTYELTEDVVLPKSGLAETTAVAAVPGPFNPGVDTVTDIMQQISGWESVSNRLTLNPGTAAAVAVGVISVGADEESDEELRLRQQTSTNATSYRQIEAIRAVVADIPGVAFVRAYQNSSLAVDARGIPGKCLALVVVGGDNDAIAQAIHSRSPIGIGYHGNTAVTVRDNLGIANTVSFSRPLERPVSVKIGLGIVVDENVQTFPANGDQLVREAVLAFAQNGSGQCQPLGNPAFLPGQDIIRSYLYTPINSIGGARVTSLQLAVDGGDFAEQDIVIAWNEIGVFALERIEVELP